MARLSTGLTPISTRRMTRPAAEPIPAGSVVALANTGKFVQAERDGIYMRRRVIGIAVTDADVAGQQVTVALSGSRLQLADTIAAGTLLCLGTAPGHYSEQTGGVDDVVLGIVGSSNQLHLEIADAFFADLVDDELALDGLFPADIGVAVYGQSNAEGTNSTPALSTTPDTTNQQLASDNLSFEDLVEATYESPNFGIAQQIHAESGDQTVVKIWNGAVGGQSISDLSAGGNLSDFEAQFTAARSLDSDLTIAYMPWIQGEADYAATSIAAYKSAFDALMTDLRANAGAAEMKAVCLQMANHVFSTDVDANLPNPFLAQEELARENPSTYVLAGPGYALPYSTDTIHLTNEGIRKVGEYIGKAIARDLASSWTPLRPSTISANGSTITLAMEGGDGSALTLDTTLVNPKPGSGFFYEDGSRYPPAIESVAVDGRNVILTMSRAIESDGVLSYATKRIEAVAAGNGSNSGTDFAPGGNLRDSDATLGHESGDALYNWCACFRRSLSSASNTGRVAPTHGTGSAMTFASHLVSLEHPAVMKGATALTMSYRFRRSASPGSDQSVFAQNISGRRRLEVRHRSTDGLVIYLSTDGSTNLNFTSATGLFVDDTDYHVCIVFDGSETGNDRLKVYVDGADITAGGTYSGTMPASLYSGDSRTATLGGTVSGDTISAALTNHQLHHFALWGAAASSAQVGEVRGSSSAPADAPDLRSLATFGDPDHWLPMQSNLENWGAASDAKNAVAFGASQPTFGALA